MPGCLPENLLTVLTTTVPFQPSVHRVWCVTLMNTWRLSSWVKFDCDWYQNCSFLSQIGPNWPELCKNWLFNNIFMDPEFYMPVGGTIEGLDDLELPLRQPRVNTGLEATRGPGGSNSSTVPMEAHPSTDTNPADGPVDTNISTTPSEAQLFTRPTDKNHSNGATDKSSLWNQYRVNFAIQMAIHTTCLEARWLHSTHWRGGRGCLGWFRHCGSASMDLGPFSQFPLLGSLSHLLSLPETTNTPACPPVRPLKIPHLPFQLVMGVDLLFSTASSPQLPST